MLAKEYLEDVVRDANKLTLTLLGLTPFFVDAICPAGPHSVELGVERILHIRFFEWNVEGDKPQPSVNIDSEVDTGFLSVYSVGEHKKLVLYDKLMIALNIMAALKDLLQLPQDFDSNFKALKAKADAEQLKFLAKFPDAPKQVLEQSNAFMARTKGRSYHDLMAEHPDDVVHVKDVGGASFITTYLHDAFRKAFFKDADTVTYGEILTHPWGRHLLRDSGYEPGIYRKLDRYLEEEHKAV